MMLSWASVNAYLDSQKLLHNIKCNEKIQYTSSGNYINYFLFACTKYSCVELLHLEMICRIEFRMQPLGGHTINEAHSQFIISFYYVYKTYMYILCQCDLWLGFNLFQFKVHSKGLIYFYHSNILSSLYPPSQLSLVVWLILISSNFSLLFFVFIFHISS